MEQLRQIRPSHLFLVADGPRRGNDTDRSLCAEARSIATRIDWPCDVQTNFSDTNMGCGRRVSSGISWVLDCVEAAIILEDDILVDPTFFPYCEELLHRFREDTRIMSICGWNSLIRWRHEKGSYFFARHGSIWGWATWRRAWEKYSFLLSEWQNANIEELLREWLPDGEHAAVQSWLFRRNAGRVIDTWDIQWTLTCMLNKGLSVMPAQNLVTNIGFGGSHTHTSNENDFQALMPHLAVETPLRHPSGDPTADPTFDRWRFLLYQLSTYRDVPMLSLWSRYLRANPQRKPPGMNDGFEMTLAALRHPGEALEILEHVKRQAPDNERLDPLIQAFGKLVERQAVE